VEDPTYFAPWCEQLANFGYGPDGSVSDCIPDPQCNDVQIQQSPLCSEGGTNIFYNIVTFSMSSPPPDDWSHEAPGCDLVAGTQYECRLGDGPLSAEGTCTDVIGCEPGCPPHYNQVGDLCVWDGSGTIGTECIAGSTYDPVNQCCTATPGSAVDFKICPAGTYPLGGDCVDDPEPPIPVSINEPLETIDCTWTGGDDDTSGCDPLTDPSCPGDDDTTCGPNNPVSCTYPRVSDGSGCNCVCPPGAPNCR